MKEVTWSLIETFTLTLHVMITVLSVNVYSIFIKKLSFFFGKEGIGNCGILHLCSQN